MAVTDCMSETKRCGCGRTHDEASWAALPLVGHMDLDEDGDQRLLLKNCPCGSTLSRELPALTEAA